MIVSILLADDHHIVRQGLRVLLEAEPDFQIVGEAGNGLEVVPMVEQLNPDVAVLDIMMPGLNGLEIARQIGQRSPHTRVIILSMYANEAYVLEALRHGAAAYVLKRSTAEELVQAVREVVGGRRYLGSPFSERGIESYLHKAREGMLDPYETLTTREREVLYLAAEGHTTTEIAEKLFISSRTVEMHRSNMMHKLGLNSQTDLVRYAVQRGLMVIEE